MSTITERVAAGMAFLDEHDLEWWRPDVERAIDVEALDLADTGLCVLGQRCPLKTMAAYCKAGGWLLEPEVDGYFAYGYALVGVHPHQDDAWDRLFDWALEHGFTAREPESIAPLTAEWKRFITERRAAS